MKDHSLIVYHQSKWLRPLLLAVHHTKLSFIPTISPRGVVYICNQFDIQLDIELMKEECSFRKNWRAFNEFLEMTYYPSIFVP